MIDKIEEVMHDSRFIMKFIKSRMGKEHNPKFRVLFMLKHKGLIPISVAAEHLCMAKTNASSLIDELIKEGKIERVPDKKDRRIINVKLTKKGEEFIMEKKEKMKKEISKNFSRFTKEELDTLHESIRNLKNVLAKKGDYN